MSKFATCINPDASLPQRAYADLCHSLVGLHSTTRSPGRLRWRSQSPSPVKNMSICRSNRGRS